MTTRLPPNIPDEAMNALIAPVLDALTEEASLDLVQDDVVACQLRLLAESGFEVVSTKARLTPSVLINMAISHADVAVSKQIAGWNEAAAAEAAIATACAAIAQAVIAREGP